MAFTPPAYPNNCTRAYWDKNKGIVAKAAGETGVGAAAKAAEDAFRKIDWAAFDVMKRMPMQSTPETLAEVKAMKAEVAAEWKKTVQPAIAALRSLSTTAGKAAKTFKASKTIPKASTQLAEEIEKAADHFSLALQLNSVFFDKIAKDIDLSIATISGNLQKFDEVAKQTGAYLDGLIAGLKKVVPDPSLALWDKEVKQLGRSVSNNLKTNPALAKKYLKTWTSKFQGFDWNALGFDKYQGEELKKQVRTFASDVFKEGQTLKADLK